MLSEATSCSSPARRWSRHDFPAFLCPQILQVASYEFTTLTCVPGVIRYRGAKIQLLDLPGIIEGAKDGKGRGRQVIATARTCNLILIVLDCLKPITHKKLIEHELEGMRRDSFHQGKQLAGILGMGTPPVPQSLHDCICAMWDSARHGRMLASYNPQVPGPSPFYPGFGLRLNKKPPEITFKKKDKGGIAFTSTLANPTLDLDGEARA